MLLRDVWIAPITQSYSHVAFEDACQVPLLWPDAKVAKFAAKFLK